MNNNVPYQTEIIVKTAEMFSEYGYSIPEMIDKCKESHINVISIQFKQDEDDEAEGNPYLFNSGTLYYPSKIIDEKYLAKHFANTLQELITCAHEAGIKVKAWIPQFHDFVATRINEDWQMISQRGIGKTEVFTGGRTDHHEYFINPCHEGSQQYELSIIDEILQYYDIDMIVLDWLRFDSSLMDMSEYTINLFKQWCESNQKEFKDPRLLNFDIKDDENCEWEFLESRWNPFRSSVIANYVMSVRQVVEKRRPQCQLGIYHLHPDWVELGVDIAKFKNCIDFTEPMIYFKDFGQTVEWAIQMIRKTADKIGDTSKIIPVMGKNWEDEEYKAIMSALKNEFPEIKMISMFNYIKWENRDFETIKRVSELETRTE